MKRWRSLVFLLLLSCGILGGGLVRGPVASAIAAPSTAPVAAEDASVQARSFSEAYNLLLDHYVRPLDSAQLLRAAWDQLVKEADGKAADPGPPPNFSGDRAIDLDRMRTALSAYAVRPSADPDGFVPAHALIRGMVHFVDEGHTYFLDQQQYRDYQAWSRGDNMYVGIGVSLSSKNAEPQIIEVYDDTPAKEAGLLPGDLLVRINGREAAGLASDEMSSLVRGTAGTNVQLIVRRGTDPTLLTFSVPRAEIHLQFVKQRTLADDIGYVSLRRFPEPSVVDTVDADIARFQATGMRGLVLDLRGNAGGRIDVGTRLLSHFLPAGSSIYQEVERLGETRTQFTPGGVPYDLPLVVLVDGGTASMGEIFAAAVQEHGAATILGSPSAGSVAAAQIFGLPDGAGVQVTVFDILSATGKPLNKVGVMPDEVIEPSPADLANGADPVLSRAIELLHERAATGPLATVQQHA